MKCRVVSGFHTGKTGRIIGTGVPFWRKCFLVLLDNSGPDKFAIHQTDIELEPGERVRLRQGLSCLSGISGTVLGFEFSEIKLRLNGGTIVRVPPESLDFEEVK